MHAKPVEPPKPVLPNRKSEGFPGFGHMETIKADQKSNDNTKVRKVFIPNGRLPTSGKSSSSLTSSPSKDCQNDARTANNSNVEAEMESPTPERETSIEKLIAFPSVQSSNADTSGNKTISVRTDLVQTSKQSVRNDLSQPSTSKQSVRNDLVQPSTSKQSIADTIKPENGDDDTEIVYDTKTAYTPHESIPDVKDWDIDEVYTYFLGKTTPEFAQIFKEHQIDGDALLLIKREDVLQRFNLKLGAALRLHAQIVALQYKNDNPILVWNEN